MLNEAIAFYLQKENQASIELLQKVIHQRPDFALAYINLSYIQEQSGLIEDAIATLQKLAGEKLDQDCVQALIDNLTEVEKIQRQFKENISTLLSADME